MLQIEAAMQAINQPSNATINQPNNATINQPNNATINKLKQIAQHK